MTQLALYLFGPPRLELDGEAVHIPRRKAMALLAYLAVTAQSHSRDSLATLFWPEHDQGSARAGLRNTLWVLNQKLGEGWLATDREAVGLNDHNESLGNTHFWLDVAAFQEKLQACNAHKHPPTGTCPECTPALEAAVEFYQDDFMAGFSLKDCPAYDEWQFFEGQGLQTGLANTLVRLSRWYSQISEYETAIGYARRWLGLDPLHEPAQRHLIAFYARSDQQAAALRQYQICCQVLEEELGVAPSEETQALAESIRRGEMVAIAGRDEAPESGKPGPAARTNLPVQTTPFVGRETELAELRDLLADPKVRLVTLLGPGGVGKTRLAQEAAAAQLEHFERGVFYVRLAPLETVERIVPTIAEALGFSFYAGGEPRKQLLDYLHGKQMLLLMDNYEHLLAGADIVGEILKTAPGVKVLATSRERLNLSGEYRYPLDGLSLQGDQTPEAILAYSAIKLFLESARRARPDFEFDEENIASIVRICSLVEGMPLAIRLAAAWVEMLSPAEIADEIEHSLDFLAADWRDMPERQRNMQAVFDHSWRLLSGEERQVFQGLSVFRGGFTRSAAEEVSGTSLQTLMALVNKSLISRDASGRYEIHELSRQYAAAKLTSEPERETDIRGRHCNWYTNALERWEIDRKGPRQAQAVAELVKEIDNIRAAWDWAVEQRLFEQLDRAINGLGWFCVWQSFFTELEGSCLRAERALKPILAPNLLELESTDESTQPVGDGVRVLSKILAWRGFSFYWSGHKPDIEPLERSLGILEHLEAVRVPGRDVRPEKAFTLTVLGNCLHTYTGSKRGMVFIQQGLDLYRELGDPWGLAFALNSCAWANAQESLLDEVDQMWAESLEIQQMLGDQWGISENLRFIAMNSLVKGQHDESRRFHEESLAIRRELGDQASIADGLTGVGTSYIHLGDFDQALSYLEESLAILDDLGQRSFELALSYMYLGEATAHLGHYPQAQAYTQTAMDLYQEMGWHWGVGYCYYLSGLIVLGGGKYVEAHQLLQKSATIFREVDHRENLGWALAVWSYAAQGLGDRARATQYLCQALEIAAEIGVFVPFIYGLPLAALLLAGQGQTGRAVELYALATRYDFVANSRWFEDLAGQELNAVASTLPTAVATAAQAQGRELDWRETAIGLLGELEELSWGNNAL